MKVLLESKILTDYIMPNCPVANIISGLLLIFSIEVCSGHICQCCLKLSFFVLYGLPCSSSCILTFGICDIILRFHILSISTIYRLNISWPFISSSILWSLYHNIIIVILNLLLGIFRVLFYTVIFIVIFCWSDIVWLFLIICHCISILLLVIL